MAQPWQHAEQPQHIQRVQAAQGATHTRTKPADAKPAIAPVVAYQGVSLGASGIQLDGVLEFMLAMLANTS